MYELILTDKQANFLFRNLFAHDPSHDFNPGSNTKRLSQLNALFLRLSKDANTSQLFNPNEATDSPFMGGGIDDVDPIFNDIFMYQDFDDSDSFNAIQNSEKLSHIIKKLNAYAGLNGMVTRSMTEKHRQMVEFVQQLTEFNDKLRLTVVSKDGEITSEYNEDELLGGEGKPITNIESNVQGKDFSKIFSSIKHEINSSNDDNKNDLIHVFNVFEKSVEFFNKHVDNSLPLYSLVNSYFVEDTLFICMVDVMFANMKKVDKMEFTLEMFTRIYNVRNFNEDVKTLNQVSNVSIKEKLKKQREEKMEKERTEQEKKMKEIFGKKKGISMQTGRQIQEFPPTAIGNTMRPLGQVYGGAVKPTINTLLSHFGKYINIDKLVENETKILNSLTIKEEKQIETEAAEALLLLSGTVKKIESYTFNSTIIDSIKDAMDKSVENEIVTEENISLNNKILEKVINIHNKKYNSVNNTLKKDVEDYIKNINDSRKRKRIESSIIKSIHNFYESVMISLNKEIKASKNVIEFVEPDSKRKMSSEGKIIANNFLTTICRGVLNYTRPKYNIIKNVDNDGFEDMYETERLLILNIAKTGKTPSKLDSELFSTFNTILSKKNSGYEININNKLKNTIASNQLENVYKNQSLYVINNAMTTIGSNSKTRIVNELMAKDNINIMCPVSSILDAQGTMGSCTKGSSSVGYISSPIDISITGGDLEMNFQIPQGKKGNYILNYYAIYQGLTIDACQIDAVISKGILNILSASNTFKSILNHLELRFNKTGSTNWSLFENNVELANIIRVASRKMMGDFLQELNAIVINGGFMNKESTYDNKVLLANGDQPSTVRSAYLLVHKKTKGDINKKSAAVSFITTSQGYLYHDDNTLASPVVSVFTKLQSNKRTINTIESDNSNSNKPPKSKKIGGKTKKHMRRTYKKKLMKTRRRQNSIRQEK